MRFLTSTFILVTAWLGAGHSVFAQQINVQVDKNPGKPHVAVSDFRASGGASSLVATFNSTVTSDLAALSGNQLHSKNALSGSDSATAFRFGCRCCTFFARRGEGAGQPVKRLEPATNQQ